MEAIKKASRGLAPVGVIVCLIIFIAYLALVPAGHWQTDEYLTLRSIRDGGLDFLVLRLKSWSPRPLSELLIYLYAQAVAAWSKPLIGEVLAPLWLVLLACATAPSLATRKRRAASLAASLLVPLSIVCMFLLGHPVSEIFYWPMASMAYLPTLAAIAAIHGLTEYADLDRASTRPCILIALLVAALSTEVGAMFVFAYTLTALVTMGRDSQRRHGRSLFYWLALPLAASTLVLYSLVHGRVSANSEAFGDALYVHQLWPSVLAALPHAAWEFVSADSLNIDARHLLFGAMTKLAFFIGIFRLSRRSTACHARQRARIALALAAFALVPITLFTAYYQFGSMACCERHATFRQCMVFIGLAASASFLATLTAKATWPARHGWLKGEMALLVALVVGLAGSTGRLIHDHARFTALLSGREETWQSGRSVGKTMTVTQTPYGGIVGGYPILDANEYSRDGQKHDAATVILDYFDKDNVIFTAPADR
jgi:hypothetical protein